MPAIQLEFFKTEQECEIEALRKELREIKSSTDKVRRGIFARNGELTKEFADIRSRFDIIERALCAGIKT